jgi:hypothetical protein
MFATLSQSGAIESPDFDEAWNRFGGGPLLEFVYLLKENQTLESRLREQSNNLRNPNAANYLQPSELQFLRAVMAISMTGASCDGRELAQVCQLTDAARTVSILEQEFLVISYEGGTISGLHPLRSSLMCKLLHDATFNPIASTVATATDTVLDRDIESFCVYVFGRHPDGADTIFESLCQTEAVSWTRFCGIQNAVMWWGIDSWLTRNREHIVQCHESASDGWSLFFDWNIAREGEISSESLFDNLPNGDQALNAARAVQQKAESSTAILEPLVRWWESRNRLPDAPTSDSDWNGLAESAYWIGYLNSTLDLSNWITEDQFCTAARSLSLDSFANLCRGLEAANSGILFDWTARNSAALVERFRNESLIVSFEDEGTVVNAHGIISIDDPDDEFAGSSSSNAESILNDLAWSRVSVMRALFPEREQFCFDGYGHDAEWLGIDLQMAHKTPRRENINYPWGPDLNHIFRQRGSWQFRPATWAEHFQTLARIREAVATDLATLAKPETIVNS